MEKIIDTISNLIKNKELVVFCGAGISKNSGIPLVYDIKSTILESLKLSRKEIELLINSNLPFESFMEPLIEGHSRNLLFNIYFGKTPNANHHFLAQLAKRGYLNTILTTNFDTLIEKALKQTEVAYSSFYNESRLKQFHNNDNQVNILKLHGCISDMENMAITIKQVARETYSHQRREVFDNVLENQSNNALLICGYSCSDIFDIVPYVRNLKNKSIEVFYINHLDDSDSNAINTIRIWFFC